MDRLIKKSTKTTAIYTDINVDFGKHKEEITLLSSVDKLAEFYDPFSDLNLFLVQKITQHMRHFGNCKKWSVKIQEELLKNISCEFQKKFPHYRLGVSALKKTWEKIAYYSQQIQQQKEAITQDGKLNIHFFIKENLKQFPFLKNLGSLHPSHFAHQLGMKLSECIATIDGVRPRLDHLTKLIWSIQRHLIPERTKCAYDECDKIDKLILKTIVEITANEPQIGHRELEFKVREVMQSLCELPSFATADNVIASISALLAEKLYPTSPFHDLFFSNQKSAIIQFIQRHGTLCKSDVGPSQMTELVRRIAALYTLASGLPKNLSDDQIASAVNACYPTALAERPDLPQPLYAFLSAELVLMRNERYCHSPAFVLQAMQRAYREAILLPELTQEQRDMLEIVIWKTLSETEGLLEKLPYKKGLRIEEEIAAILIENPKKSFSSLVTASAQFFKRTKELLDAKKCSEIERKIHMWVIQGDMLHSAIPLDPDSFLMKLICKEWNRNAFTGSHHHFVSHICQEYLKSHPEITIYAGQLSQRVWILYKHAWYTLFNTEHKSSYERFLEWHASSLRVANPQMDREHCLDKLAEAVAKTLPLVPFDRTHCSDLIK